MSVVSICIGTQCALHSPVSLLRAPYTLITHLYPYAYIQLSFQSTNFPKIKSEKQSAWNEILLKTPSKSAEIPESRGPGHRPLPAMNENRKIQCLFIHFENKIDLNTWGHVHLVRSNRPSNESYRHNFAVFPFNLKRCWKIEIQPGENDEKNERNITYMHSIWTTI